MVSTTTLSYQIALDGYLQTLTEKVAFNLICLLEFAPESSKHAFASKNSMEFKTKLPKLQLWWWTNRMIRSATLKTHVTSKNAYIHRQDEKCNSELTQKMGRKIDNAESAI